MNYNDRVQIVNEIIKLREYVFTVKTGNDFNDIYDRVEKALHQIRRNSKIFIDKKLIYMDVEEFEGHIITDNLKKFIREV